MVSSLWKIRKRQTYLELVLSIAMYLMSFQTCAVDADTLLHIWPRSQDTNPPPNEISDATVDVPKIQKVIRWRICVSTYGREAQRIRSS